MDSLEAEIISGSGTGEHLQGLLPVGTTPNGTRPVAYTTDVLSTLRRALTVMQTAGEMPNAVVLSPADAETVDLARWGSSGGFLSGGFANDTGTGFGTSANIFGGPSIQRVVSPSMPTGIAVLGDWSKVRLFVRESVNVMFDFSGDHFTHNTFIARGEGRFGVGWLRPSAFAVCDLTA